MVGVRPSSRSPVDPGCLLWVMLSILSLAVPVAAGAQSAAPPEYRCDKWSSPPSHHDVFLVHSSAVLGRFPGNLRAQIESLGGEVLREFPLPSAVVRVAADSLSRLGRLWAVGLDSPDAPVELSATVHAVDGQEEGLHAFLVEIGATVDGPPSTSIHIRAAPEIFSRILKDERVERVIRDMYCMRM